MTTKAIIGKEKRVKTVAVNTKKTAARGTEGMKAKK